MNLRSPYLKTGESKEGLFIGPIYNNSSDSKKDHLFLNKWAYNEKLQELNFDTNRRPMSLIYFLEKYPSEMAQIFYKVINNFQNHSYLVETGILKKLWSDEDIGLHSLNELESIYNWDRGLIRDIDDTTQVKDIFISSKKVPILRTDYHEACSGKGFTSKSSHFIAIAESLERYSAFLANNLKTYTKKIENYISLDLFPNEKLSTEDYAYVKGHRFIDNSEVFLPASLVSFPNIHPSKVAIGSSSGLAFHLSLDEALLRAIDEVYEKDNLYYNFFNLVKPYLFTKDHVLRALPNSDLENFIFIYYKNDLNLPIVHGFYFGNGFISRGSGNSLSIEESMLRAYSECLQCSSNYLSDSFLNDEIENGDAFRNWKKPEIITEIKNYLNNSHPTCSISIMKFKTDQEKLNYLRENAKNKIYYLELPKIVSDALSIRVLIEGMLTSPSSSINETNPSDQKTFKHGIPT